jgi:hypothetical protein
MDPKQWGSAYPTNRQSRKILRFPELCPTISGEGVDKIGQGRGQEAMPPLNKSSSD